MIAVLWVFAVIVALDTLAYIGRIGKPRDPITPLYAVLAVMQYGTVVGLLVWAAVTR